MRRRPYASSRSRARGPSAPTEVALRPDRQARSGVNFNLDLDVDASRQPRPSGAAAAEAPSATVSFVEDIVPDARRPRNAPPLGDHRANEMQFAGHADVKWTIGPVDEAHGRKLSWSVTASDECEHDGGESRISIPKSPTSTAT